MSEFLGDATPSGVAVRLLYSTARKSTLPRDTVDSVGINKEGEWLLTGKGCLLVVRA